MDYIKNLKKVQKYLKEQSIDYLFVNSNYKFLKDGDINENIRFLLSGFNGTAGALLISQNQAYIFVDGRYHIQVDEQVDKKFITPIKLSLNQKLFDTITSYVKENSVFSCDFSRISVSDYEKFEKLLKKKKVKITDFDTEFLQSFVKSDKKKVYKIRKSGINTVQDVFKRLKKVFTDENIFLSVFSNDEICYLTGLRANKNEFSSSFVSFAFLSLSKAVIFCDKQFITTDIKKYAKEFEFVDFTSLNKYIKLLKGKVLLYHPASCPYYLFDKFIKNGIILKRIRKKPISTIKSQKTNKELEVIKIAHKKAAEVVLTVINHINNAVICGKQITLGDFYEKLKKEALKKEAVDFSFKTILAVNEGCAVIHNTNFNPKQIINNGDLILLDFGLYFQDGYATDMTRTFCIGNKCNKKEYKTVYTQVLKAFLSTLNKKITKDTTYFDLDFTARKIINKSELKGYNFNHATGHGIGLNVHEFPPVLSMSKLAKEKVKPNRVFSIEPGMYKENVCGVRIEDSVFTTETKQGINICSLTNLPFDEKLIIKEMLTKSELKYLEKYKKGILTCK